MIKVIEVCQNMSEYLLFPEPFLWGMFWTSGLQNIYLVRLLLHDTPDSADQLPNSCAV